MSARRKPAGPEPTELRRLIVQALGRTDWSLGVLARIGGRLTAAEWPEGSEGARVGVLRALAGAGNLRLQLLGAFAAPGWSAKALAEAGGELVEAAPGFAGEEIVGLRLALGGGRG